MKQQTTRWGTRIRRHDCTHRAVFRVRRTPHRLAHRDSCGPYYFHYDGLHYLCQSGHPGQDRHADCGGDCRHLLVRSLGFSADGSASALSACTGARHGPKCLFHLYRLPKDARSLADRTWCGLSVRSNLSSTHRWWSPPDTGRCDSQRAPRSCRRGYRSIHRLCGFDRKRHHCEGPVDGCHAGQPALARHGTGNLRTDTHRPAAGVAGARVHPHRYRGYITHGLHLSPGSLDATAPCMARDDNHGGSTGYTRRAEAGWRRDHLCFSLCRLVR